MALQTNVYRDGAWVTERIDLDAVLKGNIGPNQPSRQRSTRPSKLGLLTRNVIESPIAHWIIPVRIRSATHNDVAFIGDRFVEVLELRKDGRLQTIARKNDFGSRIRNVKPLGLLPNSVKEEGRDEAASTQVKTEDEDVIMNDSQPLSAMASLGTQKQLPPQMLLLVLESGDCVLLFLRPDTNGQAVFESTLISAPHTRVVNPGFHMAVDPSSRYVALGCAEGLFVVHELESIQTLNEQYCRDRPLRPFRAVRPRSVQGVIHKMEFLYPRPEDDYHVILLLIVVRNGKSRMVTYEWEAGDDLRDVFGEDKRGHRLPVDYQMPVLVIPLTVRTAFFAISSQGIAVCKDVLQGPPDFEDFQMTIHETSEYHHGLAKPIWTAWTRPYRLSTFSTSRDNIYLAREDGVVMFLDIDSDNILGASVNVGNFKCNIANAFCALQDNWSDILIMGGDSGPGAIWQVPPREPPVALGTIANWSPVVDFVTTDPHPPFPKAQGLKEVTGNSWPDSSQWGWQRPDRLFVATGKGITGSVTEYRYGLEARIGPDVDYEVPIRDAWIFPAHLGCPDRGFHILLSMPDRSTVLHLSDDYNEIAETDPHSLPYDLSARTIVATQLSDTMALQVTENYVVISTASQCIRCTHIELLGDTFTAIMYAAAYDRFIALATYKDSKSQIHILQIAEDLEIRVVKAVDSPSDVTCLALGPVDGEVCVFAGLWEDFQPKLFIFPVRQVEKLLILDLSRRKVGSPGAGSSTSPLQPNQEAPEAPRSIVCLTDPSGQCTVLVGTNSGEVLTLVLNQQDGLRSLTSEKFGQTAAQCIANGNKSAFICCDSQIVQLVSLGEGNLKNGQSQIKHWVWPVDGSDAQKPSPAVDSASVLRQGLPGHGGDTSLLLVSGSRILLTGLATQPQSVPRSILVGGTPSKLLYLHSLDCLVVAVQTGNRPVLKFIDTTSGEDLSLPSDKEKVGVKFIAGLGEGDKIEGLSEWEYTKDDKVWRFVLVSTKDARLIVVSMERIESSPDEPKGKIRFWTRYKRSESESIHSIIGDAENLFYCVGTTLHWDILDLSEKKLKPMKTFELSSPATSLTFSDGKIIALTDKASVQIIDPAIDSEADQMVLAHVDIVSRPSAHCIEAFSGSEDPETSILLVSDRSCGVVGLWVPWQQPGRNCEVLFEADLPASIRKFQRGKTRPSWQQGRRQLKYGHVPSTVDGADILGVCMDGSLYHFALLNAEAWAVLGLIQNLAQTSELLYPFQYEPPGDPDWDASPVLDNGFNMHIDGDMLQRCFELRAVERLFARRVHAAQLVRLLNNLDGGRWTMDFRADDSRGSDEGPREMVALDRSTMARYFALVYDILEYYLAPVI
ncbi:uncharacterized protein E0L32_004795 [Thyridium curvatum]|uniref:RSE1/DDB1/CPSF1 first beta-propeller domain-containing protein n=1 Tax=Thyridium curvatum TaxID=1093900 RepID=A0A507AW04_9PEZI|nr:uncharacterized protein E0L32_004795 [Thyridium curvatum]TPX14965.1 hypothetical protein E0L32_004795 [Thyridium curvatum]